MWPLQALVPPGAKSWGAQLDCQKHPCTSLHHAFHPMIGFSPHIFEMIRWTYQQYRERVNEIARGLMALGLNKGDHVALWAINLPEWPLLELAALKAGLVLITVNPVLRAHEVEYILKQGDAKALFFMARIREHDCLA